MRKRVFLNVFTLLCLILTSFMFTFVSANAIDLYNENNVQYNVLVASVFTNETTPTVSIGELIDVLEVVVQYFDEVSYERVHFTFDIIGWTLIANSMRDYVNDTTSLIYNSTEVIPNVENIEGYNAFIVIHAGDGYQHTKDPNDIHSCFNSKTFRIQQHQFHGACIISELDPYHTITHELGHWLGAQDLYDYDYKDPSLDKWGLMASGTDGMCAYTKIKIGFLNDDEIYFHESGSKKLTLSPLSWSHKEYRCVRFDITDGRYLLLEARHCSGFDTELPSEGLLIYVVNQTTIDSRNGGIQVELLEEVQYLENAPIRVGEVYSNSEFNLHVRVVKWSESGLEIEISEMIGEGWIEIERYAFPDDVHIDRGQVLSSSSYNREFYSVLQVTEKGHRTIRILKSMDGGRTWEQVFDSFGQFNVSYEPVSFCLYDGVMMLVGSFQMSYGWIEGLITCNLDNSFNDLDLEHLVLVNETLYPEIKAVSDGEHLYIACLSRKNSTMGITYLHLTISGWYHNWVPTLCWEISLSNCPSVNKLPYLLFRNESGLFSAIFNSTSFHQIRSAGSWNIQIAFLGELYIGFNWIENDSRSVRVLKGTFESEFNEILRMEDVSPNLVQFCTRNETMYILYCDDNVTLYEGDDFEGTMYPPILKQGKYVMSRNDSSSIQHPLILILSNNRILSLKWNVIFTTTCDEIIWFVHTDRNQENNLDMTPMIVFVITIIGIIIIIEKYSKH